VKNTELGSLSFIKDQQGQATTEYILLLATVVAIFMAVRNLLQPVLKKLQETLAKSLEKRVFNPRSMHQFPLK